MTDAVLVALIESATEILQTDSIAGEGVGGPVGTAARNFLIDQFKINTAAPVGDSVE